MNPLEWDAPWVVVFAALFVIVFCRAGATYLLGRAVVTGLSHHEGIARRMQGAHYQRATRLISRYGAPVVSLCFVTVGFQTVVLLAAGASKMPARRFVPALIVGGALWAAIYSTIGFVGFALWTRAYAASPAGTIVGTIALVAAVAGYMVWRSRRPQDPTPVEPERDTVAAG